MACAIGHKCLHWAWSGMAWPEATEGDRWRRRRLLSLGTRLRTLDKVAAPQAGQDPFYSCGCVAFIAASRKLVDECR